MKLKKKLVKRRCKCLLKFLAIHMGCKYKIVQLKLQIIHANVGRFSVTCNFVKQVVFWKGDLGIKCIRLKIIRKRFE